MTPQTQPPAGTGERVHALDGLRASALLVGVVFHATLAYVMPPGEWAVGVTEPNLALWWFVHYTHDFRMPLFFVLAGFFAARVVARRGGRAYLRDRAVRIGLIFAVVLVPMKYLINLPWIAAGLETGWLVLPPDVARLPLTVLAIGSIREEVWPAIRLTHLWFLYVLFILSLGFVGLRAALYRIAPQATARASAIGLRLCSAVCASRLAPLWLALPVIPWLAATPRGVLESPDRSFVIEPVAGGVFGLMFALGWAWSRKPALLAIFAGRWVPLVVLSAVVGTLALVLDLQRATGAAGPLQHGLAAGANALTLSLAVLGWTGCFVALLNRPSPVWRYLADSSYWVYLSHLPIVVALQFWTATWPPVLGLITTVAVTFGVTLAFYHFLVRSTALGLWLNGRAYPARAAAPA